MKYFSLHLRIRAHRNVLFASSDFFYEMFSTDVKQDKQQETSTNEISIKEFAIKSVDGAILQALIVFCYSGEISINNVSVERLWKASVMLSLNEVKEICIEFYLGNLKICSCLEIWEIAKRQDMPRLKEEARAFVLDFFMEVAKCREFLKLDSKRLSVLLRDDEISIPAEEEVFNALMGWIKHDVVARKQCLDELLECVRLKHVKYSVSES